MNTHHESVEQIATSKICETCVIEEIDIEKEKCLYKKEKQKEWLEFIGAILLVLVIGMGLRKLFILAYVPTGSMTGTLNIGNIAFVGKLVDKPDPGDIVVFKFKNDKTLYVKRVIGVPNDTIEIDGVTVYRNGEVLEEDYLYTNEMPWSVPFVTLGEDEYFLMGDNRDDSFDCRGWGPVVLDEETYIGKVFFKLLPPGKVE